MDEKNDNYDVIKLVNNHYSETKREPGKIVSLANYANTKDTRAMIDRAKENDKQRNTKKRNIKNKPSNRKWLGKLAVVAASVALFAAFVDAARNIENKPEPETPTTEYTETYEREIAPAPDIIDTISEVEEDFVERYLEAYNEKYGTDYKTGDMIVTALRDGAVYELSDGRKVTRGSKPYETEKELNNIGKFDITNINSEVVQVISNGRTLGTYNMLTGEFMYSGNQIEDLKNEDFEEPTLESLGINTDKLTKAAQALRSKGVEGKQSEDLRVQNYVDEEFER